MDVDELTRERYGRDLDDDALLAELYGVTRAQLLIELRTAAAPPGRRSVPPIRKERELPSQLRAAVARRLRQETARR